MDEDIKQEETVESTEEAITAPEEPATETAAE